MSISMFHESIDPSYLKELKKASVIILSEGKMTEQYMIESYTPGNKHILWGNEKYNPFFEFYKDSNGILRSTGKTCICLQMGRINNISVAFIHPTSNVVDYEEVTQYFKNFINVSIIEFDNNFICNLKNFINF